MGEVVGGEPVIRAHKAVVYGQGRNMRVVSQEPANRDGKRTWVRGQTGDFGLRSSVNLLELFTGNLDAGAFGQDLKQDHHPVAVAHFVLENTL